MNRLRISATFSLLAFAAAGCNCNDSTPEPAAEPPTEATETQGSGDEAADEAAAAPDTPCGGPEDVVAFVECEPVMTVDELEAGLAELVERYERLPDRDSTTAEWRNERRRRLVRTAVQAAILDAHAAGHGVAVTDEEVDEAIRGDLGHVYEDERLFERFLESRSSTRELYEAEVRRSIAIDRILQERGQLEPTPEDVQRFYEQNRERWREGDRVRVRTITIRLRGDANEEDEAAARERIDALRARVVSGEDFGVVAEAESESADRIRGGDRGWIVEGRRRQLVEDGVEEVLFSAEIGDVTEPIRTRLGWQIYEIVDKRPEGFRDLDEVEDILREPLRRRNRDRLSRELENELVDSMDVLLLEDRWGLEEETGAGTNPAELDGFNRPVNTDDE